MTEPDFEPDSGRVREIGWTSADQRRFDVVTFDADFTLVRHRVDKWPVQWLAAAGHRIPPQADLKHVAAVAAAAMPNASVMWSSDSALRVGLAAFYRAYLRECDVATTERLVEQLVTEYLSPTNWRPYIEVGTTLGALRQLGVHLGVVAHWGSDLSDLLHAAGIRSYFEFVLSSAAVGATKANGGLYHLSVKAAGVPARLVLHVGDDLILDVQAAQRAGLQAALVDRSGRRGIPELRQVVRLVAQRPRGGDGLIDWRR